VLLLVAVDLVVVVTGLCLRVRCGVRVVVAVLLLLRGELEGSWGLKSRALW
jgi:hypothetical protein